MRNSISQREPEPSVQGEKPEIPPELHEIGIDGQSDPLATLIWEMRRFLLHPSAPTPMVSWEWGSFSFLQSWAQSGSFERTPPKFWEAALVWCVTSWTCQVQVAGCDLPGPWGAGMPGVALGMSPTIGICIGIWLPQGENRNSNVWTCASHRNFFLTWQRLWAAALQPASPVFQYFWALVFWADPNQAQFQGPEWSHHLQKVQNWK